MNTGALIAVGIVAAGAAWYATRRVDTGELDFSALGGAGTAGASLLDSIIDSLGYLGMVRVSAMKTVEASVLDNRNVRAMLAVIRRGEGTAGSNGYSILFGGETFAGFADHPRRVVCRTVGGRRLCSSAAGAYQFLTRSWDETRQAMNLPDFSPRSQDLAAVGRMAARGALKDVIAGRFDAAVTKLAMEWASLPGSPYGQPVISATVARQTYLAAGGSIPGVTLV